MASIEQLIRLHLILEYNEKLAYNYTVDYNVCSLPTKTRLHDKSITSFWSITRGWFAYFDCSRSHWELSYTTYTQLHLCYLITSLTRIQKPIRLQSWDSLTTKTRLHWCNRLHTQFDYIEWLISIKTRLQCLYPITLMNSNT